MSEPMEEFEEYRMVWDYPYLQNKGEVAYGDAARSIEEAHGKTRDEAWQWAGRCLGYQKRTVIHRETDWEDLRE